MRVKVFQLPTIAEAMARVRAELGPEALILSTRRVAGGVEVTAAIDPGDDQPQTLQPQGFAGLQLPAERRAAAPKPVSWLQYHAVPPALAARLDGPDLTQILRANFRFGTLPIARDGPPLMLVGMPGAGKTLSIARLATRMVLAGISPLVISADGQRAGGAEELAAYTRLLGAGLLVATTPATLGRALGQRRQGAPALIDTAGLNPFDPAALESLCALSEAAKAIPVLVMSAGLDVAEAEDQVFAVAPLGARHLLGTRLDLTRRLGSLLTAAFAADLIMTEAGIGAGATDGLAPLTPEFLAERLYDGSAPAPGCHEPRHQLRTAPDTAAPLRCPPGGGAEQESSTMPEPARPDAAPALWTPRRLAHGERAGFLSPATER